MEGPPGNNSEDKEGIIPRAMKQVFLTIKELKVAGWTVSNASKNFIYEHSLYNLKYLIFSLIFPMHLFVSCIRHFFVYKLITVNIFIETRVKLDTNKQSLNDSFMK